MKKIIFFLLIISFLFNCKDDEQDTNVLPEATQSGKNTGGAVVNGEIWVAKIESPSISGGNITQYNTSPALGQFMLNINLRNVNNTSGDQIKIFITSNQDITTTSYQLSVSTGNFGIYSNKAYNPYYTDATNSGILTITKFDKVNQIVSGTFAFKAINSNGELINITEGRFDKKFQQ